MTVNVNISEAAVYEMLNSPTGPVGEVIGELSEKAAAIAKARTPVMERVKWYPQYQYGPPGETKASVHPSGFRYNGAGQIYSGVNVNYGPTLFLQRPARQIHTTQYMFMTQTINDLTL